jgi:hypothetical protein
VSTKIERSQAIRAKIADVYDEVDALLAETQGPISQICLAEARTMLAKTVNWLREFESHQSPKVKPLRQVEVEDTYNITGRGQCLVVTQPDPGYEVGEHVLWSNAEYKITGMDIQGMHGTDPGRKIGLLVKPIPAEPTRITNRTAS